jgi:hypothetical protein
MRERKSLNRDPQTLINQTLRQAAGTTPADEATLRRVLREELKTGSLQGSEPAIDSRIISSVSRT